MHTKPKFLVADDDPSNRLILKRMLDDIGTVDLASSGEEALELFKNALQAKNIYQVIFLDILMPGMDGQQVLAAIRDLEQHHEIIPGEGSKVIMVTSVDDESSIFESHIFGCEGYLVKPFSRAQIQERLLELGFWSEQQ